jgi:hypothetical protein
MPDVYANDCQQFYFDCTIFTGRFWYKCSFLLEEKSIYSGSQGKLAANVVFTHGTHCDILSLRTCWKTALTYDISSLYQVVLPDNF